MPAHPDTLLIAADRVIAADRDLTPGLVEVQAGRIARVRAGRSRRADVRIRGILAPGLIDLQINGAAGVDFTTCDRAGDLDAVHRFLASTGVTAYLPTLISSPLPALRAALVRWARFAADARTLDAPRILGVHLEGPYLNPAYAGAHDPGSLRAPDRTEFTSLLDAAPGFIKLATLAPELQGAAALISAARRRKVVVAAGHTGATYDEARAAFRSGVSVVTHLFNAMRPMHHREPGLAGAALADERVVVGLIADFVHVHMAVVRTVLALLAPQRVLLVTDALAAVGMEGARTHLAGREVVVTDAPRLAGGTLAGSVLTLDRAVRNVTALGLPVRDAVGMASAVPAAILRRRDLGRIAPGARADLVAFAHDLTVRAVYVGGRRVVDHPTP